MQTVETESHGGEARDVRTPGQGELVVRHDQRLLLAIPLDRSCAVAVAATTGQDYDATDEIRHFGTHSTLSYDDDLAEYLAGAGSGLHIWEGSLDNQGFWFEWESQLRPIMQWKGTARVARLADLASFAGVLGKARP